LRQWDRVLFSDETKINLVSLDGRIRVRREPKRGLSAENCIPTIKHGGGDVTLWGCMSSKRVGRLEFIEGIMDRYSYKRILAENLVLSCEILGLPEDFIFQQDNNPKHKSQYVREFFRENSINVLDWPSQSPDLNPIEHLWDHVKRGVRKLAPKNIRELKEKVIQISNEITPELCKKLVHSIPKRMEEVVRAEGGAISF
jgi:transposase